ncbi:MAG: RNA 2',3'-cyclic phosphodiesterase [Fibrobacter sp.]|nr:RNA 2',3'-cyclic phosphodiesterase [Fibrobacter sp.]
MPRLFIAVDIPERIKNDITDTYMALPGARWVEDEKIHITLSFIGEVDNPTEQTIKNSLRTITVAPFTLSLKGVGYFPPRGQPRIIWVGLSNSQELIRLQGKIERVLTVSGIETEKRKFHPHITIARLDNTPEQRVAQYLALNSLLTSEPFEVSAFHLYTSILRKEGALYSKSASFSLC